MSYQGCINCLWIKGNCFHTQIQTVWSVKEARCEAAARRQPQGSLLGGWEVRGTDLNFQTAISRLNISVRLASISIIIIAKKKKKKLNNGIINAHEEYIVFLIAHFPQHSNRLFASGFDRCSGCWRWSVLGTGVSSESRLHCHCGEFYSSQLVAAEGFEGSSLVNTETEPSRHPPETIAFWATL